MSERRWLVSTNGGVLPLWAPSGQELFYAASDHALMSVAVSPGPGFNHGTPMKLFDASPYVARTALGWKFSVSRDGRSLMTKLVATDEQTAAPASIVVVENWFEELKRRVPRR